MPATFPRVASWSPSASSEPPQKQMHVEHAYSTTSPVKATPRSGSHSAVWPGMWPGTGTVLNSQRPQRSICPSSSTWKGTSSRSKSVVWAQIELASSSASARPTPSATRRSAM